MIPAGAAAARSTSAATAPERARPVDELAHDYILLGLSVGRLEDGIVDAYYGPPEVRAEADAGKTTAEELAANASALRTRAAADPDPLRARWLDRQLVALETLARRLAGEEMAYLDEVERCFDARPTPTPPNVYQQARDELDQLLPPGSGLRQRLEERNNRLTIPPDRLDRVVDWTLDEVRRTCLEHFPAPEGDSLTVSMVSGQPWAAYNWYDGGLRSRIEINTDLPARAPDIIGLVTHEAFPGHHLEHAWKEQRLVREQDRHEATLQLVNTPEAYISEGLAELGRRYVIDRARWQELLEGICERAGIDPGAVDAEREWLVREALHSMRGNGADAALLMHVGGRPREEVVQFLEDEGLRTRALAERNVEFISHPLWRTYAFCYSGGEQLLQRWCAAAGDVAAQRGRFFRLLTDQLTPSGVAQELAVAEELAAGVNDTPHRV
jgi:hypothetical protein